MFGRSFWLYLKYCKTKKNNSQLTKNHALTAIQLYRFSEEKKPATVCGTISQQQVLSQSAGVLIKYIEIAR